MEMGDLIDFDKSKTFSPLASFSNYASNFAINIESTL
jgi:hypothetical protein